MQHLQWSFVSSVILVCVCVAHYVIADTYYIVTSTSSSCPGEFSGDPCLTLQQYAANLNQDSNITLMLESGTHELQDPVVTITSISEVIMIAEGAQIGFYPPRQTYYYYSGYISYYYFSFSINNILTIRLSGIHFSCTAGYICQFRMEYVQELIIEDCSFEGVELDLYYITSAVILQSCFYDVSALSITSSSTEITKSTFSNNTQAISFDSYREYYALTISESTFINNTSTYKGAAVYVSDFGNGQFSILINASIFIDNTAAIEGGALYLGGRFSNATGTITNSTFIYNSANSSNCGAISVTQNNIDLQLMNSVFYHNRANGDGGAACVRNADLIISKCTFVQNHALGNGGAFLLDNSTVDINFTLFKNNNAGQDGGALATYAYPSSYMIIQSSFIDNHAEDDGGAVFIGRMGSDLEIEQSTFINNHATDRGGAITIYGSMLIVIATNVYSNMANLGNSICSCDSEVKTSFPDTYGQIDPTNSLCTNYDTTINYHDLPLVHEQGYPNTIQLSRSGEATCPLLTSDNSLHGELRKTSIVANTAVTISVTLALALLLYIIITKVVQYRMTQRATSDGVTPNCDQIDPLYEEARDCTSKSDTKDIEMIPNVVYGKHTTSLN